MTDNSDPDKFGRGLAMLLRDYMAQLKAFRSDVATAKGFARNNREQWVGSPRWHELNMIISPLEAALLQATREASQLAEQGAVSELTRVRLSVRRAQVEGLLQAIRHSLNSPV